VFVSNPRAWARGVVVHTGSAAQGDWDMALRHARECLLPLLESIPDEGPDLLLEPMAGQGGMLCAAISDLPPTWTTWTGTRGQACAWTPATPSPPGTT
jgi:endonuclease IV